MQKKQSEIFADHVCDCLTLLLGGVGGVARHSRDISKIAEICCDTVCATLCSATWGHSNGVTLRQGGQSTCTTGSQSFQNIPFLNGVAAIDLSLSLSLWRA